MYHKLDEHIIKRIIWVLIIIYPIFNDISCCWLFFFDQIHVVDLNNFFLSGKSIACIIFFIKEEIITKSLKYKGLNSNFFLLYHTKLNVFLYNLMNWYKNYIFIWVNQNKHFSHITFFFFGEFYRFRVASSHDDWKRTLIEVLGVWACHVAFFILGRMDIGLNFYKLLSSSWSRRYVQKFCWKTRDQWLTY